MNWRARAEDQRIEPLYVLLEVRKQWPREDWGRVPRHTRDLDLLDDGAPPYDVRIEDGARLIDEAIARVVAKDLAGRGDVR